jgi:tetratricopeptide (TPR) repeat protein
MTAESLVRAVEIHLLHPDIADRTAELIADYDRGLILVPYFAAEMDRFEQGKQSILEMFPDVLEGISWDAESRREDLIEQLRQAATARPAQNEEPVPAAPSELRTLLKQANSLLVARRFDDAEPVLKQVLTLDATNASALFGLAQIAGQRRALAPALDLYEQAAAHAGDQTWIAAWCFVYRGNIFGEMGDITKAREQWNRVLGLPGNLHGAGEAARRALAQNPPPARP